MARKGEINPEIRDAHGNFIPWKERNREKANAATRKRRAASKEANPDKQRLETRKWYLKRKFGITPEFRDVLIAHQDLKCAICGDTFHIDSERWAIDHCHTHESGYIRGMLCKNCNCAIGLLKDSPSLIRRAAEYLDSAAAIPNEPSQEDFEIALKDMEAACQKLISTPRLVTTE